MVKLCCFGQLSPQSESSGTICAPCLYCGSHFHGHTWLYQTPIEIVCPAVPAQKAKLLTCRLGICARYTSNCLLSQFCT